MIQKFKAPNSFSTSSSSSTYSTTTLQSSTSSTDSSTSSSPFPSTLTTRCSGLNLLVKAIHQVTAGSVIGVPYIQKRVIRRCRRRAAAALSFDRSSMLMLTELFKKRQGEDEDDNQVTENEIDSLIKRQKRVMALPSKYQDSVLQSWKQQKSTKFGSVRSRKKSTKVVMK